MFCSLRVDLEQKGVEVWEEFVECVQSGIRGFGEGRSAVDKSKSSPFGDSEGFEAGGVGSQKYGTGVCHDRADTFSFLGPLKLESSRVAQFVNSARVYL